MAVEYSIVVATRDRASDVRMLLDSLHGSGHLARTDAELIIVDNGSTDGSTRDACAIAGVRYMREDTPGKSRAINKGIAAARGEFVAFTDDDVVITDPAWLERLRAPFLERPSTGYVAGNVIALEQRTATQAMWERKGGLSKGSLEKRFDRSFLDACASSPWPLTKICAGANCMIPRTVLDEVGGYSTVFGPGAMIGHGESLLIGYEIARRGYELAYTPHAVVHHRHPQTERELARKLTLYGVGDTAIHAHIYAKYRDLRSLRWAVGGHQRYVLSNLIKSIRGEYALPPRLVLRSLWGSATGAIRYAYKGGLQRCKEISEGPA